jgi:hypothetical protein
MKKTFLVAISILFFISQPSEAKKSASNGAKADQSSQQPQNEIDITKFNFEKIFAEADEYFKAAEKWEKLKCTPETKFLCTKKECPKINITSSAHMILDKKSDIISLCNEAICEYYPAEFEQTGVFINAKVKKTSGIYIRVLGDSRYKAVNIIGLDVYINNGACEPLVAPIK